MVSVQDWYWEIFTLVSYQSHNFGIVKTLPLKHLKMQVIQCIDVIFTKVRLGRMKWHVLFLKNSQYSFIHATAQQSRVGTWHQCYHFYSSVRFKCRNYVTILLCLMGWIRFVVCIYLSIWSTLCCHFSGPDHAACELHGSRDRKPDFIHLNGKHVYTV